MVNTATVTATIPADVRIWLEEQRRDGYVISKIVARALVELKAREEAKKGAKR